VLSLITGNLSKRN